MFTDWQRLRAADATGVYATVLPSGILAFRIRSTTIDETIMHGVTGLMCAGGRVLRLSGAEWNDSRPLPQNGCLPATLVEALELFRRERVTCGV